MSDTPNDPRRPAPPGVGGPTDPLAPSRPPDDGDDDYDDEALYGDGPERRWSRGRLVGLGVVAVALVGAGAFVLTSGDSGEDPGGDGGANDDQAMADAAMEYAECMRENGIEMPDPEISEGGGIGIEIGDQNATPEEMEAAEEECRPILEDAQPEGGGPQLTPEEVAERQDQALAMAQCMRDRGYEGFPDPEVDENGGIGISIDNEAMDLPAPGDPGFEEFEQAQRDCDEEAGIEGPEGGEGGLSGGGGGS